MSRVLVTGGSGFIGSALVKALLAAGDTVRVLDNNSRGSMERLSTVARSIEFVSADIRHPQAMKYAVKGMDEVIHLAYVNGTPAFYRNPELVLDVAVKGIVNVIDACVAYGVPRLTLASSSEVYGESPMSIPTHEHTPLVIFDVHNPRWSYGGGKIISELMALNFGRGFFKRVLIFRPHNVYGPDMGYDHVIPQFALQMKRALRDWCAQPDKSTTFPFPIQGTGGETRSFCHIDDLVAGILIMREKGEHLGIYNIGTQEEVTIADLAYRIAMGAGLNIEIVPSPVLPGSTLRRCPDISKLAKLGYSPRVMLDEGLPAVVQWYWGHEKAQ